MAEATRKTRYSSYGSVAYDPFYEGNAVRRPREGQVVRPRVLPQEHAESRPRVQVRQAGHVSLFAVAGFIAAAVMAVMILSGYSQLNALSDEVVGLQSEYSVLKSEEARLLAQYELAYDLKGIESAVTADGRMVKPQSSQIHYMDLSDSDSVKVFEPEAAATVSQVAGSLWQRLSEYLS